MKRVLVAAAVVMAGISIAAGQENKGQEKVEVPVSNVVLFSSGVGYFEHTGQVEGDAETRLMFKTDQINDVLKSMVVMDLSEKGSVRRVGYASREPLERVLKSFAVDISGAPTLPQLLEQLRGAEVEVQAPDKVVGKILSVEKRTRIVGDPPAKIDEYLLSLLTPTGIRSIPVSNIQSMQLTDRKLAGELNKALDMLVAERDKDRKPVEIKFTGQGERKVRIGYITEAPVWKMSYRLDLTDADKPLMQGWAIVENVSESDWENVRLTLVSGRPISFIQDLYTPMFVPRPVVVPETYASLQPRMYGEGIAPTNELAKLQAEKNADARRRGRELAAADRPAAAMAPRARAAYAEEVADSGGARLSDSLQTAASAGKVGELFQYTLTEPVTLARRRSAMLPVVNATVNAEKVSIYNQSVLAKNPLNGLVLINDTGMKMLAGPVTVFDGGAYAGDARLDHIAPGDKRLVSYAIDLNVTVDPSQSSSSDITGVKIVRGVLYVTRKTTYTHKYVIKNKADAKRTVIVEHPFHSGRKLIEPEKYDEKTASLYRFRVPVAADQAGEFVVSEEQVGTQTISILSGSVESFTWYRTNGEIDKDIRDALTKAASMKNELSRLERELSDKERELAQIKNGQDRLRRNLQTVGSDSTLGKRYLQKLSAEEDQIEKLEAEIKELRDQVQQQRDKLEDYLKNLNVG